MSESFWSDVTALDHVTPAGARWAEGYPVLPTLAALPRVGDVVLDFGCGDGRLTPAFNSERYIGVDINPFAIDLCRTLYPSHRFERAATVLPEADMALCYTVLLHVDDATLPSVVARLATAAPRVVVVEILGRRWRGPGLPPVFNRELNEYVEVFARSGMWLQSLKAEPYHRYEGTPSITFMDFRRGPVRYAP